MASSWCSLVSLTVMVALPLVCTFVSADYDSSFCTSQLAKTKKKQTGEDIAPYFYDDYSIITEATFYKVVNKTGAKVIHHRLHYSKLLKQVVLHEDTPNSNFWVFVDQGTQECIYKKDMEQCVAEEGDCKETAKTVGFGNRKDEEIVIGSPSERMDYPTNIKKSVSFGSSKVREVKTKFFGICSYRQDTDETVVSLLHLLDTKSYPQMDQTKKIVLASIIYTKTANQKFPSFRRLDFTDYKPWSAAQLSNAFSLGGRRCGTVKSKFTLKKLPEPTPRFLYVNQKILNHQHQAFKIQSALHDDNLYSRINTVTLDRLKEGEVEKDRLLKVEDFNGKNLYEYSVTKGECKVSSLSTDSATQPSSRDAWELNSPNPTYLGVYENRGIPCNAWHFDSPSDNTNRTSTTIYTATSDWLKKQGKPTDMFLPVQKIDRNQDDAAFQEIYSFKDNPGYHIPELRQCFQQDDVVVAELTLLLNYARDVEGKFESFLYKFRTLIMKITGIVSPIRIGFKSATPSQLAPKEETIVKFEIYGKLVGHNDANDKVYRYDAVTSQKAAEKINSQVDKGIMTFTLDKEQVKFYLKKGSFAVVDSGTSFNSFRFYDPQDAETGYSSLAMAGVGIAVLVVCLALGLGAVLGYKRWSEGALSNTGVSMKTLQEES